MITHKIDYDVFIELLEEAKNSLKWIKQEILLEILQASLQKKTYTLNSSKSNCNFNSEIPKTVVKNSEGNYISGRNNE